MPKNNLKKLLFPAIIAVIVLYVLFMSKKEGFQDRPLPGTTSVGCDGAKGEVFLTTVEGKPMCMRLQYTTNGTCTVPNPNPNNYYSFLYNPPTSFIVNPTGKKLCVTFTNLSAGR